MKLRASEFGVRLPVPAPFSTESLAPFSTESLALLFFIREAQRHHPTGVSFQFPILS